MTGFIVSVDVGARNFAIRVEPYVPGPAVVFDLVDLVANGATLEAQITNLTTYLDSLTMLSQATLLLIEHQEIFPNQRFNSTRNLRLMQHVLSYFELRQPHVTRVEVPVQLKTHSLTGYVGKHRREALKTWALTVAPAYLMTIQDAASAHIIRATPKGDDLCDTVLQLWAYRLVHLGQALTLILTP